MYATFGCFFIFYCLLLSLFMQIPFPQLSLYIGTSRFYLGLREPLHQRQAAAGVSCEWIGNAIRLCLTRTGLVDVLDI